MAGSSWVSAPRRPSSAGEKPCRTQAEGRTFIYFPKHTREQITSRFLNKVFGGAIDQFVLSMRASDAGPKEFRELEELIAKVRSEKRRKKEGD